MAAPAPIKKSHRGLLHRALGIPEDEPISMASLMRDKGAPKKRGNGARVKQDTYAINARNWNHG